MTCFDTLHILVCAGHLCARVTLDFQAVPLPLSLLLLLLFFVLFWIITVNISSIIAIITVGSGIMSSVDFEFRCWFPRIRQSPAQSGTWLCLTGFKRRAQQRQLLASADP